MACCNLLFFCSVLAAGKFYWHCEAASLQSLAAVTLVCSGQAAFAFVLDLVKLAIFARLKMV